VRGIERVPAGTPGHSGERHPPLRASDVHAAEGSETLRFGWLRIRGRRVGERIEVACGGAHFTRGDAEVAGGGRQAAMTKQELDGTHVGAALEQMDREGMWQRLLILLMI